MPATLTLRSAKRDSCGSALLCGGCTRNTEILFSKAIAPFEGGGGGGGGGGGEGGGGGVSTINLIRQCSHSIQFAGVGCCK